MSIETFLFLLVVTFVIALGGVIVGLVVAWPRGGRRGWSWKWAGLLIASALLLAAVVAVFTDFANSDWGE